MCKSFLQFHQEHISLITESVKFAQTTNEHRILSYVAIKTLILINSLLANAVTLKSAISEGELSEEKTADIEDHLAKFKDLYRVQPEGEFVLNTLLASSIDPDVAQEVVRLHGLLGKLR
ncbi:CIC11C00000002154 [Sungouiella intermedia]|uniref:CIC11C00000002154 n=1 Tax=Sungouiella intermedia TaxID=45354 RepID=A0A1L0C264_9ASCO|nr:CIC11C00000002154 [[Candida] intermedia]